MKMIPLTAAALINIGGPSNTRDVGSAGGSAPARSIEQVAADLQAARRAGARLAIFVGGEPTLRRDLGLLLRAAAKVGLASGIVSNGRMLVYPKVRSALVQSGLVYLRVGLHGPSASIHDSLVRVDGAFDQTFGGLKELLREAPASCRVDVACTVTAANVQHLEAWVDALATLPRVATLGLRLVGPALGLDAHEWVQPDAAMARVAAALDRAQAAGADIVVTWEGYPPCLLDGAAHLRDETLRFGAPAYGPSEAGGALVTELPDGRAHPYPCQECIYESTCPGAEKAFLARHGEGVLRPTQSVRANSFNYELVRRMEAVTIQAGSCPVLDVPIEGDRCRSVFLVDGEAVSLYHSPTSDFTDAEVRRVKDELQQLYIDLSAGAALNDFLTVVRRVRLHEQCRACADRPRCSGAVALDPEPPFLREERWLRKEVSRLRGRVLDVGCGDQLYRDEIRTLIAKGEIEYHGLDPDDKALRRFGETVEGAQLHHGTIESFVWEPGYFDYVLCLRSINHFRDMVESFRVISDLMRVQGQMVLCDSPPFGMLRSSSQVTFADHNAPVGHEHFRNWTSHQVVEFLKRFPFRVDVHRPVNTQTSNQWIIKVMRTPNHLAHEATSVDP